MQMFTRSMFTIQVSPPPLIGLQPMLHSQWHLYKVGFKIETCNKAGLVVIMLLQVHTLPIATDLIFGRPNFKNFYSSDASVNAFKTLL